MFAYIKYMLLSAELLQNLDSNLNPLVFSDNLGRSLPLL